MMGKIALYFIIVIVTMGILAEACDLDQMGHGCRIANNQCSCGYGCKAEYRYDSNESCKMSLKGRGLDICNDSPCLNHGSCLQISPEPGYKCQCEGTGFYGPRCERSCPPPKSLKFRGPFPHECVVI